ncbi:MAG: hypothetical protein AB7P50_07475 [Alphaproteobacteria bacterium]
MELKTIATASNPRARSNCAFSLALPRDGGKAIGKIARRRAFAVLPYALLD